METESPAPTPSETTQMPADRRTEFVAVSGGSETTSAESLLVTAYLLMWAVVFGFLFLSLKRQRQLDRRLGDLEAELKRLDTEAAAAPH